MKRFIPAFNTGRGMVEFSRQTAELDTPKLEVKRRSYYKQRLSAGKMAVLDVLRGIRDHYSKKSGRKYCFPTQETILDKLSLYFGIEICRRTLNYWLADLQKKKLIARVRNLTAARWSSTRYYLCDRGGSGVVRAKKFIGMAKRLGSILPARVKKIAHNMHTSRMQHTGGGLKDSPPAPVETKRCEASELKKDVSAPSPETRPGERAERPESMRQCLKEVYERFNASVPVWKRRPVK